MPKQRNLNFEIENSSESDFESAFRKCKSVFDRHASQAAMQDTSQLFTDSVNIVRLKFLTLLKNTFIRISVINLINTSLSVV